MSDRLRVLIALHHWRGAFTIAEIAERSGVNIATVRTVLGRERRFVRAQGKKDISGPGGRSIVFIVNEAERSALANEIRSHCQELSRLTDLKENSFSTESYLEPPLSLVAAEDALKRQFEQAADNDERTTILSRARRDLNAAQSLLRETDDGSIPYRRYSSEIALLEGLANALSLSLAPGASHDWVLLFQSFVTRIADTTESLVEAMAPKQCSFTAIQPNYPELFKETQEALFRRYSTASNDRLPPAALKEAANHFASCLPAGISSKLSIEDVATRISEVINPELPLDALLLLGREPASYQKDVVCQTEDTIVVKSMNFNLASHELGKPETPITLRVMSAGTGSNYP